MKALMTSYFASRKHATLPAVSIASYAPKWWKPARGRLTEPSLVWRHFRTRKAFEGDWREDYRDQLAGMLEDGSLQAALDRMPEGAVMLCWEKDPATCHRTVLANFLTSHGLADVREL
jgi:hypothetical protein